VANYKTMENRVFTRYFFLLSQVAIAVIYAPPSFLYKSEQ